MNDKTNRLHQTFIRIRDFGRDHASEFAANGLAKQSFTTLDGIITELEGHAAAQVSGVGRKRHGTITRAESGEDLRDLVTAVSRTAGVLHEVPGVSGNFELPDSDSDQAWLARARAFATDLAPFASQFEAQELPGLIANLNEKIAALEAAIEQQASGTSDHVASRAAVEDVLERGLDARRTLDVVVRNKYQDDPVIMAKWASAHHIERVAMKQPELPTAAPATPTTPTPTPVP
jgi:hypothetical protein